MGELHDMPDDDHTHTHHPPVAGLGFYKVAMSKMASFRRAPSMQRAGSMRHQPSMRSASAQRAAWAARAAAIADSHAPTDTDTHEYNNNKNSTTNKRNNISNKDSNSNGYGNDTEAPARTWTGTTDGGDGDAGDGDTPPAGAAAPPPPGPPRPPPLGPPAELDFGSDSSLLPTPVGVGQGSGGSGVVADRSVTSRRRNSALGRSPSGLTPLPEMESDAGIAVADDCTAASRGVGVGMGMAAAGAAAGVLYRGGSGVSAAAASAAAAESPLAAARAASGWESDRDRVAGDAPGSARSTQQSIDMSIPQYPPTSADRPSSTRALQRSTALSFERNASIQSALADTDASALLDTGIDYDATGPPSMGRRMSASGTASFDARGSNTRVSSASIENDPSSSNGRRGLGRQVGHFASMISEAAATRAAAAVSGAPQHARSFNLAGEEDIGGPPSGSRSMRSDLATSHEARSVRGRRPSSTSTSAAAAAAVAAIEQEKAEKAGGALEQVSRMAMAAKRLAGVCACMRGAHTHEHIHPGVHVWLWGWSMSPCRRAGMCEYVCVCS